MQLKRGFYTGQYQIIFKKVEKSHFICASGWNNDLKAEGGSSYSVGESWRKMQLFPAGWDGT